jgi:5-methyltetrahydropteroyltriglutamate--homocysteine methyltransferase
MLARFEEWRTTVTMRIAAYQHGIYPRSEDVVAATRGLERGRTSAEEVARRFQEDRTDFIVAQRDAGLDYLSDGLLRWQDIFRPLVEAATGMTARTLVRWFDNNSFFRAPEVRGPLTLDAMPSLFEDEDAPGPRVATLPSPYMFSRAAQTVSDRNALMMELSREILRPVAQTLAGRGYEVIHLQEPWLVYFGMDDGDWDDFAKAIDELRDGVEASGATLVLHTYFGDAAPYADRLRSLPVHVVGVDFVETDLDRLGRNWEVGVLAGCLDGRRSPLEDPMDVARFATAVADTLAPSILFLSSNSDLELLPRDVARGKVHRLGAAAARLKEAAT